MSSLGIIVLAIALAMDAFAVSITCGMQKTDATIKNSIKVGLFFGIFQALMPILGYFTGNSLPFDITYFDHWIAFVLLGIIGGHMIKESFADEEECTKDLFNTKTLTIAAIATSIDALAAGLSISFLNENIMLLVITTGIVTAALSVIGVKIGKRLGHLFESRIELISGLVLILIGLKILIEHLTA